MSEKKKSYLQQRAEEAVRKTPYVRTPKGSWMEEALEEVAEDLAIATQADPNLSWDEIVDQETLRLERHEAYRFGEVRSTVEQRRAFAISRLNRGVG